MNTFKLQIVTPTHVYDEGEVTYLRLPGTDGLFGIMAGHAQAIFAIQVGGIKIVRDGKEYFMATSGGYTEVTREKVQVLAETAERSDEIDIRRAEESKKRAGERLHKLSQNIDFDRAKISLLRAINRLKIAAR